MVQESREGVKQSFTTVAVPKLPLFQAALGPAHEAEWDLPQGQSKRALLPRGATLHVRIVLKTAGPKAAVRVLSHLGSDKRESPFVPASLIRRDKHLFEAHLPLAHCGRFALTAQYTLDGKNWFWMRGDHLLVIVYPRHLQGMRMYIFIPLASGPLASWKELLPEIKEMGFTMVHLLPLSEQGASESPYAARSLFDFEPSLAAPGEKRPLLKVWEEFVAAAKALHLGLCLDLVLNHVAIDSDLMRVCPHWFVPDESEADGVKRAGFWAGSVWEKWNDLALINYAHPDPAVRTAIWTYFRTYALYWSGFAAETQGMVRLDNLHSTPPSFALELTRALRDTFPDLGIFGEYFGTHESLSEEVREVELDLILATTWEHHFTHELRRYLHYLHETSHEIPWFCPVNSHDSGPPAQEFASVLATRPRYLVSALLGSGATGLSQGVEKGLLEKINFIGRQTHPVFDHHQDYRRLVTKINRLLAENDCFQQGASIHFVDRSHTAVIAAIRYLDAAPEKVVYLIVANLDIHNEQTLSIDLNEPLLHARQLFEVLGAVPIEATGPLLALQLEPCGVRVIAARPIG